MINWKTRLEIPHTSSSLCTEAGDKKNRRKIPVLFLLFRLLRSQQRNRSTEGCCLCLLCNTGCLLWKCKGEDEGEDGRRKEGGRDAKKEKKGNSVYSSPVFPRPAGRLSTVSGIEPSESLAKLIQSIPAHLCLVKAKREPVLVHP